MKLAIAGATGTIGRYATAARTRGHDVVSLSRSDGVNVAEGSGLAGALHGVDVVIDVCNADTIDEDPATEFFTRVAGNLQRFGTEQGVERIVTLSIVGIDGADFGYYRAKAAVGQALIELAEQPSGPRGPDLAGPPPANLVDLGRAFVRHRGSQLQVDPETTMTRGIPDDGLLPDAGAKIIGPSFSEWLTSSDAADLPL